MTAEIEKEQPPKEQSRQNGDILDLVGGDGPWQRRIFLVILFCAIPSATHNLSMSFLAPNLDHWCARPAGSNLTVEQWKIIGLPPDDQQCSRYKDINFSLPLEEILNTTRSKDNVVACDAWEYDETFYTSTVSSQWDLVCNKEWLVSMSKSVFMAGILVACILFGHMADSLGRRPAIAASACTAICSALICAFSTSFTMFIITRFFMAVGIAGVFNTAFVLLLEVVGPQYRSVYGIAVEFGWCLGFVCLPVIAWMLRDWFWIQVALTAPCLVMLAIWWMIPESPRWLMSQGKVEKAQKILHKAAKANGVRVEDIDIRLKKMMTKATEVHEAGEANGNVLDLWRTPGLWQKTLNVYCLWFVNSFVYYGLSYNTNELAGNPFVNFALSGAVEFPGYLLTIFAIRSLGRRNPLAWSMIAGGIACLLMYPLPQDPWWLSVSVSMFGKFCITCSFAITYVFTAEIFPTVVRNIGLGSASLFARFGSVLAPFVRELGNATHPVFPQIVFGILAGISGLLVFLLPETNNCSVPDTLKEAAEATNKKNLKSSQNMNGNHVIVTMTETQVDEISSAEDSVFPPSPKPEKNGKVVSAVVENGKKTIERQENGKKLADVPEEDSHCEEVEESKEGVEHNEVEKEEKEENKDVISSPQEDSNDDNDVVVDVDVPDVVSSTTDSAQNEQKTNL
ncbi:organic cation transporter protein-like [Uloborus diversus]|uniref:organic cation transporter protein-like n=1 Tax=Uloborus diversus TaxID=327109 RepID=UPI00240A8E7B|nr:organic cation transporter protein-like [Uloborus diversus]